MNCTLSRTALSAGAIFALSIGTANAATEVEWWHAMGGKLGEKVQEIADGFNASQSDYVINPVYKGNYTETMTAAISAFRADSQPAIVQVFEVGTATMMAAKGAVYPVYKLMDDAGEPFDPSSFLAAVTGYYTDTEGNMLSLPFNSSTPVLYYNKTAFENAGLDADQPPRTWEEVESAAKALQAAGTACGFTTGWQSWVQLENFSAWHNVPFGTKENGFAGVDTEFTFNSDLHVRHINALAEWQKSKIFDYGGRRSDSAPKFYNQECAMYMNSSAALKAFCGRHGGI
ncbi:MAG: extracellular solute-binding protein, partial [Rhodospirillaceae bacterium]